MIIIVKENSIENMELHFKIFHFVQDYLHKVAYVFTSCQTQHLYQLSENESCTFSIS